MGNTTRFSEAQVASTADCASMSDEAQAPCLDEMPIEPLLYESHCHTPLCKHASGTPSEYAAVAEQRGLKGIVITCHGPLPNGLGIEHRMAPEEFAEYDISLQLRCSRI